MVDLSGCHRRAASTPVGLPHGLGHEEEREARLTFTGWFAGGS